MVDTAVTKSLEERVIVTEADLERVLEQNKGLSATGYKAGEKVSFDQFKTACIWLSLQKKIKNPNRNRDSYGYKHEAECFGGRTGLSPYVSNGALIAAAIHTGFSYKRAAGPNVYLNISNRLWDEDGKVEIGYVRRRNEGK